MELDMDRVDREELKKWITGQITSITIPTKRSKGETWEEYFNASNKK